jgi:cell division protein FtsB
MAFGGVLEKFWILPCGHFEKFSFFSVNFQKSALHLQENGLQYTGIKVATAPVSKEERLMDRIIKLLKRVRLVYRRSSMLTKAVVLSAIILSTAALITLQITLGATQDRTQELANQAAQLEQENQKLEENIDGLGSADSVGQIAKDELGLVDPDTVVVQPTE